MISMVQAASAHIISAQDEKLQATPQALLRAVGEGGPAGIARTLAHSQHRERAVRRRHCRDGGLFGWRSRLPWRTRADGAEPGDVRRAGAWVCLAGVAWVFFS